ncbi:hypothetical protein CsSME_00039728 [Camellia sinensis var. sinensis]
MARTSDSTSLNRSAVEVSRARSLVATASNRSDSEIFSSAGSPTRFSNRVTLSFKASMPETIRAKPCSDTNCYRVNFRFKNSSL